MTGKRTGDRVVLMHWWSLIASMCTCPLEVTQRLLTVYAWLWLNIDYTWINRCWVSPVSGWWIIEGKNSLSVLFLQWPCHMACIVLCSATRTLDTKCHKWDENVAARSITKCVVTDGSFFSLCWCISTSKDCPANLLFVQFESYIKRLALEITALSVGKGGYLPLDSFFSAHHAPDGHPPIYCRMLMRGICVFSPPVSYWDPLLASDGCRCRPKCLQVHQPTHMK